MLCRICGSSKVRSLGTIPFDRNNAGVSIVDTRSMEYHKCDDCDYLFCEEMLNWTPSRLGEEVYNADYVKYDPDYANGTRATNYASFIRSISNPMMLRRIKHLDYGSGAGGLSAVMKKVTKQSESYDPFSSPTKPTGLFNLVTAIEVLEHSQDPRKTLVEIKSFLDRDSVLLFSTQFATENTSLDWWYIGARNGHISILSKKSIKILARELGLFACSYNDNVHMLQPTRSTSNNLLGFKFNAIN